MVAVKIIDQQVSYRTCRSLLHKVRCMEDLYHPNIVQLFHVISTAESLFLAMELMPGENMHHYLRDHNRMSENKACSVFWQLVSAVHYCHEKGIAHRDLKPQNVLLDTQMNAKLADFARLGASFNVHQLSTFCGGPAYVAPELSLGEIYDGRVADIWSLRALLYKMLTNTIPFKAMKELMKKLGSGQYAVPPYLSIDMENFLKKLLTLNSEQRQNLKDIMPDSWLNMGQE
ncbi:hypothetical protein mRhiFer1_009686 [Rhinolophus ferrumequinum]|uniref:non-specific serine/threonine protein kinase n=1 Tax=Rhinolophus ferrumequinum TaxID=59479 RepID=A0A7J7R1W4_RHIFE|nr:hypothetical protein mRhiFer1_009686 [Rhinolophus ferrumequinum]